MYETRIIGMAHGLTCLDDQTTLAQVRGLVDHCGLAVLDTSGAPLQWGDLYRCGDIATPFGAVLVDRIRRCGEGGTKKEVSK